MFGSGGMQERMMQTIADPSESEQIRGVASAFAEIEATQREQLLQLAEAVGADPEEIGIGGTLDKEQRVDAMCDALAARMAGDPWEMWTEWGAPEEMDNLDRAEKYAGLDAGDWEDEKAEWAAEYRESPSVETDHLTDDDLAEAHVQEVFGVDLDTFRSEVVEWTEAAAFETVVTGPLIENTEAVEELNREVDA